MQGEREWCRTRSHRANAGGCMLALAHDYRVMNNEKGLIFLSGTHGVCGQSLTLVFPQRLTSTSHSLLE